MLERDLRLRRPNNRLEQYDYYVTNGISISVLTVYYVCEPSNMSIVIIRGIGDYDVRSIVYYPKIYKEKTITW